jgi:4-hydroxybenzoyl-CoA reductase subunit beta
MMLTFELRRPTSIEDVLHQLADGARPIAGGTDLLPNLRRGIDAPPLLASLERVAGLDELRLDGGGAVLGAGLTLARLAADPRLASGWYRALAQAAEAVAGPAHRQAATLGGNLCQDTRCVFYNQSAWWRAANDHCLKRGGTVCHVAPQGQRCNAAYSGDVAPALLVLGAEVDLLSLQGARRITLDALYRDDGAAHLTLEAGELLRAVRIAAPPPGTVTGYLKGRVRGAMDFPLAGVAAALALRGGVLHTLRIALTGTDSRPFVLQGCDGWIGRAVDAALLDELGKAVARQVSPARTTVTPSNHRRLVASTLARRLVSALAEEAPGR